MVDRRSIASIHLVAILPVAALLPAQSAALPLLRASVFASTPEDSDVGSQDRIHFPSGGTGTQAFVTEFYDDGGEIVQTYVTEGGDTSPGGLDGAVQGGTVVFNDWVGSGSALARFDRLAVDAYWHGTQDDWGYVYGGGIDAEATAWDRLTIEGDGMLTYTYDLTGSLVGRADGLSRFDSLWDVADMDIRFTAEFDKVGSADDAKIVFGREIPNPYDLFFIVDPFSETLELSIEVSDGDVIEHKAAAYIFLDVDSEYDVRRIRARTDFGSTAELVSVFTSEGVSFTADSGFDYLSVNSTVPDGDGDDPTAPITQPPPAVPLPAAAWLLIAGLGAFGVVRSRSPFSSAA